MVDSFVMLPRKFFLTKYEENAGAYQKNELFFKNSFEMILCHGNIPNGYVEKASIQTRLLSQAQSRKSSERLNFVGSFGNVH